MSQDDQSGSESHEEEEEEENGGNGNVTSYEKQRMKRMEENKARMEAMGLHKMANSLMGSLHKKLQNDVKGKRKAGDYDDEEYRPPQENEVVSSSSEEEDQSYATRSRKNSLFSATPARDVRAVSNRLLRLFIVASADEKHPMRNTLWKQRMKRMEENKAKMEAMGLHKMANSLMGSLQKKLQNDVKGKRKAGDDDEEYRPPQENEVVSSSSEEEDQSYSTRSRKSKKQNITPYEKLPAKNLPSNSDYIEEYDDALMQAIALSFQDSAGFLNVGNKVTSQSSTEPGVNGDDAEKKPNIQVQEEAGKRKRKKMFTSRVQMTEDELILHFFQFDEAGKGGINVRDLCRIATAHDFAWSDKEMKDMIRVFDSDGDGKLSLDDFSKIVDQCNMRQKSENTAVGSRS